MMVKAAPVHLRVLPETRGECRGGVRPCPLVSCRYHLLLNVTSDGRMYSQQDFDEDDAVSISEAVRALEETCALDVADRQSESREGGLALPLEEVARLLGIASKAKAHAVEQEALAKLAVLVADDHPDDPYFRVMAVWEAKKR